MESSTKPLPALPAAQDPFIRQVSLAIAPLLFRQNGVAKIVVAFSGGPDSCALLAALCALAKNERLEVAAMHVNHKVRGKEADADENFCAALCEHWHVPLQIERLSGEFSDEARLRDARYAALAAHAQSIGAAHVMTGHTRSDQSETILFRLFRGTGPGGLMGMPITRELAVDVALVRPLLQLQESPKSFLERNGIAAQLDSSNNSDIYGRNYIRRRIIPAIAERFSALQISLERLSTLVKDDEEYFTGVVAEAQKVVADGVDAFKVEKLLSLPLAIRRRLVANMLRERAVEVSFERTEVILKIVRDQVGAVTLNEHFEARIEKELLVIRNILHEQDDQPTMSFESAVNLPGLTVIGELGYALSVREWRQGEPDEAAACFPESTADEAWVDLNFVATPLVVRSRRPGDVIQPFGMNEPVKLKKYLHTHPQRKLDGLKQLAVLANDEEVLWVPGVGLSEKLRVARKPTHTLRFVRIAIDEIASC